MKSNKIVGGGCTELVVIVATVVAELGQPADGCSRGTASSWLVGWYALDSRRRYITLGIVVVVASYY